MCVGYNLLQHKVGLRVSQAIGTFEIVSPFFPEKKVRTFVFSQAVGTKPNMSNG